MERVDVKTRKENKENTTNEKKIKPNEETKPLKYSPPTTAYMFTTQPQTPC